MLIFLLSFGTSIKAQQSKTMFNTLDSCKPWSPKKTARLLLKIDRLGQEFEFKVNSGIVTLQNKASGKPYAIFFDTAALCKAQKTKRP
jgi:hypothetical protein